jgi:hypothetical protein
MELLNVWQSYVDVIYMTETQITMMDHIGSSEDVDGLMNVSVN